MLKSVLGRTRRPDVSFSRSGRIELSSRVAQLLYLRVGDVIDIFIDDRTGDCFLCRKCHAQEGMRHEAQVYRTNSCGKHFRTYSRRLCREVLRIMRFHGDKIRLPIGGEIVSVEGDDVLPIINNPI